MKKEAPKKNTKGQPRVDTSTSKEKEEKAHQHDENAAGHDHDHGGMFGKNTELIFAALSGLFLALGFGLSFVHTVPPITSTILYGIGYFFGGFYTTKEAYEAISTGKFEIDFLMLVAAVGAACLGQWAEGALLLFLFSFGHSLEHYAMGKATKSIAALADLAPKTAIVRRDGKETEVPIEELVLGDIIIVKPNSKISADGAVIKGESSVNQAPITGESVPVDKSPVVDPDKDHDDKALKAENKVFAGTINGSQVLEIKVTKLAADSTLSRLVKLVNDTEAQKSPTQLFTDKLQKYYVPAVLALVGLLLLAFLVIDEPFSKSFYRAMAVLVAASPCALAISTPSAVLSAIARAARSGVLIKGGGPLEELGGITAIAFDKTGTLTEGKPQLTGVVALAKLSEDEVLEIAIAVEKLSDHPLAAAIVKGGLERLKQKDIPSAKNLQAVTGHGVKATVGTKKIIIGNRSLFKKLADEVHTQVEKLEKEGNTTMLVEQEGEIIGLIALMDVPRKEAKKTLKELKDLGIKRMIMLTGDNQQVAEAVAKQVGITDAMGGLLPEQKVKAIQDLIKKEKKVAMIGDGVNDAPAMAKSTVGIAMGAAGSDVALETADIALMADRLDNLPFAIGLSRQSRRIIKQNLVVSLGMVAILIPVTILGITGIGPAVIGHEGSTLLVVFNGLRLLVYQNGRK
ncbi:heavy metal translocating P-type ATPase [Mucilaginibacter phyllosphaerae]|uniref:P-type Zn(2+) transporter n=1 Tax=Mucilaginibacter phyllosphaerae TaxID=1812349 RepID=A0A4Y8AFD3_9SPHI|nr:heavy metal translocating P-type ATPase [Mucilaginibacter phyllosphaerae]MBB3971261.1 Cd2+/Zn2+-exporting ATPase [Mucilaginibacter phyllosphaerae]TEW66842.1 cadmium-translocating P-type ATPase [Mucilaginibacter phyllosphaerae]GGH12269.1 ATPase [Mucilaginibacter phyllosphaerae]